MMRKFHLLRVEDESGVSGTGKVAEGIIFSNGYCCMTWLTKHTSVCIYRSIDELEKIHGHHGKTRVVFEEDADKETLLKALDFAKKLIKEDEGA